MIKTAPYAVRLGSLTVAMFVGLHDWEKEKKQPVSLAVTLYGDDPGYTTDITKCIDYSRVHQYVTTHWPGKPHTDLLETLADELVTFCLSVPLVRAARVRISKPAVFEDGTLPSVELYRENAR
ncbi:MAG: dihydroneopterin aldolase [Alphaproteobacteria bacterium]|nr:dihydroneopterin aldolase [Alphaproteobacteria bacterium]